MISSDGVMTHHFLADLKPSGKYVMQDLHEVGGIPAVMKMMLNEGLLDGSCLTVTGHSIATNLADVKLSERNKKSFIQSHNRLNLQAIYRYFMAIWPQQVLSLRSLAKKAKNLLGQQKCITQKMLPNRHSKQRDHGR
jgi:dihydroxyacid dehydratase/phosphogluconate dehydratase